MFNESMFVFLRHYFSTIADIVSQVNLGDQDAIQETASLQTSSAVETLMMHVLCAIYSNVTKAPLPSTNFHCAFTPMEPILIEHPELAELFQEAEATLSLLLVKFAVTVRQRGEN